MINIEICKSSYKENAWNLRIGNIEGAIESSNISLGDVLENIEFEMLKEK